MEVPMLDLKAELAPIKDEIKSAVIEVVESAYYVLGPKVVELEERIAEYTGVERAVAVSSGTDALLIALMALDVGPGDLVVTTPYSFFATAGVIVRAGATPAFVDIDPDTYNMDPAALRQWFDSNSGRLDKVKAIIPVHLFGQCADMDGIMAVANEFGIPVIEDAAQAIGASYPSKNGMRKAGGMGAAGCFSFYPTKNLGGMGEGGMVVTNDGDLADKIAKLRNHGSEERYYHSIVGGNFRMDALQGAVLLVKLKHLEEWHAARRKNARYYLDNLKTDAVSLPKIAYDWDCHIFNQYVVNISERREELRERLRGKDIAHDVYYPMPFHLQKCFEKLGYKKGDFPNSEFAAGHSLALPIYPQMTTGMQDYVIETITGFYSA